MLTADVAGIVKVLITSPKDDASIFEGSPSTGGRCDKNCKVVPSPAVKTCSKLVCRSSKCQFLSMRFLEVVVPAFISPGLILHGTSTVYSGSIEGTIKMSTG